MTTATRRLRRAGVAGLATIATVGGLVLATGGTAFAAPVGSSSAASGTAPVVYPGTSANAVADLTVGVPNLRSVGDTVTVQLGAPGFDCATTGATVGFNGTPTVAVTGPFTTSLGTTAGTNAADVKPTFTVATASTAGACTVAGVKDQLVITLTNSGAAGDFYTLTVSGQKIDVGAKITPGSLTETVNALPAVTVATVANTKLTVSKVVATTPTATNVAIGDITASDVGAANITGAIAYTLTNAVWNAATAPTMTGPAGLTWAFTGQGTATLTATPTGPAPTAASTYTLSKATIDPAGAGPITVTAMYGANTIGAANTPVAAAAVSKWTGGVDRYATAAQLFSSRFPSGGPNNTAVLASGVNFPDALSANNLASRLGTGVLLTTPTALVQSAQQAIITGGISTVYIVGGTAAISQAVQTQLGAMHVGNAPLAALVNVVRIAGADRYATSNAINLYADANAPSNTAGGTAVVATGVNFADALAIGPAVFDQGYELVLTDPATLSASAQSTLVNLGVANVIIVGGVNAVSANVETQIKALGINIAYRIAGADRTQTAAQIATFETAGLPAASPYAALGGLGFGVGTVNIARGDNFPDALAAGAVEGANGQVILLTSSPSVLGAGIPAFLAGQATGTLNALGLTGAVSAATMQAAVASLAG